MKLRIVLKDPDGVHYATRVALDALDAAHAASARADRMELRDAGRADIRATLARFVAVDEFVTLEFDTATQTAVVVPRDEVRSAPSPGQATAPCEYHVAWDAGVNTAGCCAGGGYVARSPQYPATTAVADDPGAALHELQRLIAQAQAAGVAPQDGPAPHDFAVIERDLR